MNHFNFDRIPPQLRPALNQMAAEIASSLGRAYPSEYDFSKSKNPKAVEVYRLAIVALQALDEYCMNCGVGLADLVGLIEEAEQETEAQEEDCVFI